MHGAAVKRKNREIRKAFGAEALAYITDIETRLNALGQDVGTRLDTWGRALDTRLAAERHFRAEADARQNEHRLALERELTAFRTMPWYRRWVWALGFGAGRV